MSKRKGRPRGLTPDGLKIRHLRVEAGLTARQLAAQIGLHPGTMVNVEGQNRRISHVFASRLARALGVSMSDITDWAGNDGTGSDAEAKISALDAKRARPRERPGQVSGLPLTTVTNESKGLPAVTSSRFLRRRHERKLALNGDFPDTGESVTEVLERVRPAGYDARTYTWQGASGTGLPDGVVAVKRYGEDTEPLARLRARGQHAGDAAGRALRQGTAIELPPPPPPPEPERAKIGDELRLPLMWCDMPSCIQRHEAPAALGEADARARAIDAGWRIDALGRMACPRCQQADPGYRPAGQVVHWHPDAHRARGHIMTTPGGNRGADAEFWARALAEHDQIRRARDARDADDILLHAVDAIGRGQHPAGTP